MSESYSIFTDGGARGNPGPAGIGGVIYREDKIVYRFSHYVGRRTNNQAEYEALIKALEWLQDKVPAGASLEFKVDSQLVARQLRGEYKIKNPQIFSLAQRALGLLRQGKFDWEIQSIPRAENKLADSLVNLALDRELDS